MRFITRLLLAHAVIAALAGAASASDARQSPRYAVQTLDGKTITLESCLGRVVVLTFINTECPHCRQTIKMMGRLQAAYGEKDLQALAVAINVNAPKLVPHFIEREGPTFPIGIDSQANARKYLAIPGTGAVMIPVLVVIDRQGAIQAEYGGDDPAGDDEPALRALIDRLIARGSAPSSTRP